MSEPSEHGGTLPTDPSGSASGESSAEPAPMRAPLDFPQAGRERYERFEELGSGGQGVVYRARDRVLGRDVAMKILPDHRGAKEDARQRFQREARAAAALHHPNIVQVFDVGTLPSQEGSVPYYTMELLSGEDMRKAIKEERLTIRDAVEVTRQVALALSCAHHSGIFHRDVKPHNIFLRKPEPEVLGDAPDATAGATRVHALLVDFGLAKLLEGGGLTKDLSSLGTPEYMPPEQMVDAGKVDARADVYSLGATLYHALTGRPPFVGERPQVMYAVVREEPVRPRRLNSRIDLDLETICLKCIAKEPHHRYQTADELAEDCRRYLAGESIAARPVSVLSRFLRKAIKHWAVSVPTAAALLLAFGFGVYVVAMRFRRVEEQAQKQRELEAEYAKVKAALSQTQEALSGERAAKAALEKSYAVSQVLSRWARLEGPIVSMETVFSDSSLSLEEKRTRNGGPWARVKDWMDTTAKDNASQATMFALAGWARRLAGYEDEGLSWMRMGTELDPDIPYGPLLRALVPFSRYLEMQRMPELAVQKGRIESLPTFVETEEMAPLRRAAEEALAEVERARVWGTEAGRLNRTALEGLRAMNAGDYDAAEQALTTAIEAEDLWAVQTCLLWARARVRFSQGRYKDSLSDMERVVRVRKGQGPALQETGWTRFATVPDPCLTGVDPRDVLQACKVDFDEAIRRGPEVADAHLGRAAVLFALGHAEHLHGEDPIESFTSAIAEVDEDVTRGSSSLAARQCRAAMLMSLGEVRQEQGEDPSGEYLKAIDDYTQVLSRFPDLGDAYRQRAGTFYLLGLAIRSRGGNPTESLGKAIADADADLKINPRDVEAYLVRGQARKELGNCQGAIADYDEALGIDPRCADALTNRGHAHQDLNDFAGALEDYESALRIDPSSNSALLGRGVTRQNLGNLEAALVDFDAAIKTKPRWADAYLSRGMCRQQREDLPGAIADFGEVVRINPRNVQALFLRGVARRDQGDLDGAIADWGEGLRLDPRNAGAYLLRGETRRRKGDLAGALSDLSEALKIDPQMGNAYWCRGSARAQQGDLAGALGDYDEALLIGPKSADLLTDRGKVRQAKGDIDSAIEDFNEALQIDPRFPDAYYFRAAARQAQQQLDAALDDVEKVLALAPSDWPNREQATKMRAALIKRLYK